MNWDDLKYLARLAETGSLSAAARALKVEHATVSRRISALEQAIGARLVDRRGGRYALTPAGSEALVQAQAMEVAAVAVARLGLAGESDKAVEFSVTAPPTIASELIVPRLPDFLARNRGISLRLAGESRNVSLSRREADIALRLSRPEQPTLTVRRAGMLRYGFFAAAAYAAKHNVADYAFVGLEADMAQVPQQIWLERFAGQRPMVFRSNDLTLLAAAAKAGLGVAVLPVFLGDARGLTRVLPDEETRREIWLTYHEDLRASPRLAAITDFLVGCLPEA